MEGENNQPTNMPEQHQGSASSSEGFRDIHPVPETPYLPVAGSPYATSSVFSEQPGFIASEYADFDQGSSVMDFPQSPIQPIPQLPHGIPNGLGIECRFLIGLLIAILLIAPTVSLLKFFVFKHKSHKSEFKCDITFSVSKDLRHTEYSTISEAVEASPSYSSQRICIFVQNGEYSEIVKIGHDKTNIVLMGKGMQKTIITSNASSENFPGATLWILGKGFVVRDLTIRNTAQEVVAVDNWADESVFFRSKLDAFSSALHINGRSQFYHTTELYDRNLTVVGSGHIYFQSCKLYVNKLSPDEELTIIGASSSSLSIYPDIGYTFDRCQFGCIGPAANSKATTLIGTGIEEQTPDMVIMQSYLDEHIEGYVVADQLNAIVDIFRNTGPGSVAVYPFIHKIPTITGASRYSLRAFLKGEDWIPGVVGFDLDLAS